MYEIRILLPIGSSLFDFHWKLQELYTRAAYIRTKAYRATDGA